MGARTRRRKTLGAKKEIKPERKSSPFCYLTKFCPPRLNNVAFFMIAGSIFIADQLSKFWIARQLSPGESWPLIDNIFHLTYVLNPGAAFGILAHRTLFFLFISLFVIALMILGGFFLPAHNFLLRFALSLQLGGALGNLMDRIRTGYVIDFLDFLIWPVFNLADIALTLGIGALFFVLLKSDTLTGN